jgi:hypothetical protein
MILITSSNSSGTGQIAAGATIGSIINATHIALSSESDALVTST